MCARASAAIGDARPANVACGRYMDFFLRRLVAKIQQGEGAYLESDEEMMVYVSGDLQGSIESAWAWQPPEDEFRVSPATPSPFYKESEHNSKTVGSVTRCEGLIEWSGWEGILETLGRLAQERSQQIPQPQAHESLAPRVQGDSVHLVSPNDSQNPQAISLNSSRISIANII